MITIELIKDARRLLKWHPSTLALKAGISVENLKQAERTGICSLTYLTQMQKALEAGGAEFTIVKRRQCVKLRMSST